MTRWLEHVDELPSCTDGETSAAAHPAIAVLRAAAGDLPARHRETLLLQIVSGYSIAQIASQLNVAESVVRTRLVRARHELRTKCGEDTREDPRE